MIRRPTIVNWIEEANRMLDSNVCIVKKAFLVTGLSNALGGEEDQLIGDDNTRKLIDEIIVEVFGETNMGFQPEQADDGDPFESDSGSEEEEDPFGSSSLSEEETTVDSAYMDIPDCDSDASSISSPAYEPLFDLDDM